MKRKILSSLFFAVVGCSFGFSAPVNAATPNDACFNVDSGTGTITTYHSNEGNSLSNPACPTDVDIPSMIGTTTITTIGSNAFTGRSLTSLTLPNTLTTIEMAAFQSNQIASILFPSSVTTIGPSAFYGNNLTSVDIPNTVTSLGAGAFQNNQIASVTLSSSITSIPNSVFYNNRLTSLTIPTGVTSIGQSAFGSNLLTSISFPSTLQTIGRSAFDNNNLSSVTIPDGVTTIGDLAFGQNHLMAVSLPASVTSLGNDSFYMQTQGMTSQELVNIITNSSSTDADKKRAVDSIIYVQISTPGNTNPSNLKDGVFLYPLNVTINGVTSMLNAGGHLIDPAAATLSYVNNDTSISQSMTYTGQEGASKMLSGYSAGTGPVIPAPANPLSPTAAELQAMRDALTAYWRVGQSVTITAPTLTGYTASSPTQTFVLGSSTNSFNVSYTSNATTASGGEKGASSGGQELAKTGATIVTVLLGAALIVAITIKTFLGKYRYQAHR